MINYLLVKSFFGQTYFVKTSGCSGSLMGPSNNDPDTDVILNNPRNKRTDVVKRGSKIENEKLRKWKIKHSYIQNTILRIMKVTTWGTMNPRARGLQHE